MSQNTSPRSHRFFTSLFIGLIAITIAYYGLIHWRVIWEEEPVALREPTFVIDMRGYLDSSTPRPYTLESLPEYTNLYGMGYIWIAAPFARWLPFSEYSNLRLANLFFLGLLLITIGIRGKGVDLLTRGFVVVLVYCTFVRSASMAASPDVLGCLLYTLTWVFAEQGRFRPLPLLGAILIGILAFLTKPYYVLGLAGLASYLFLFRSMRAGLIYTFGMVSLSGVIGIIVKFYYPYYFDAVVKVHAATTSRMLEHALRQWGEFAFLLLIPCGLALVALYRFFRRQIVTIKLSASLAEPFISLDAAPTAYAWGAGVAVAALAISLSWHEGAYLTYFWHLLLPLLAIWLLESKLKLKALLPFYCLNMTVLLASSPPLPRGQTSPDWLALKSAMRQLKNPYVDPYFESLRSSIWRPIPDNGHGEYLLLYAASERAGQSLHEMTRVFLETYIRNLYEHRYDAVILIQHNYFHEFTMEQLTQNYRLAFEYKVRPYYYSFGKPTEFGVHDARVLVYLPQPVFNRNSPGGTEGSEHNQRHTEASAPGLR